MQYPRMDPQPRTKTSMTMLSRGFLLYGVAFAVAVLVAVASYALVGMYGWLIIPIIAAVLNAGGNLFVSYIVCTKTQFAKPLSLGGLGLAVCAITLLLVRYVGFLGRPLQALMPMLGPDALHNATEVFYVFWMMLYTQLITGGMVQSCGA